jgi:excisionase family DNA binding protein|tara:strand:- start:103 stop:330 length:228 start_codon:yes stop_codon:yes gene_type:complete
MPLDHLVLKKLDEMERLLSEKSYRKWLTLKQVCDYTGLSESTIRRMARDGRLIPNRKTGRLLFKIQDVENFFSSE